MPRRTPAPGPGRNDPCPCGSGRKYKSCCGKGGAATPAQVDVAIDVPATLRRATAFERAGRHEEAIRQYRQILRQEPRHAETLYRLGCTMEATGRLDQAIDLLRRAIGVDDRPAIYHAHLGAMHLEAGHADQALTSVERAIAIDADGWMAHHTLAQCLERLNRLDEAVDAAERALTRAGPNPAVRLHRATLARRRGDADEARRRLEAVLEEGGLPAPLRRRAWNELGFAFDRLGEYDAALAAFERCGKETMEDPAAQAIDAGAWSRRIGSYRSTVTPTLAAAWRGHVGDATRAAPVFMVGFPRSGTTLTEQVLAAHPEIVTSDEEPLTQVLDEAGHALLGGSVPERLATLDATHAVALRQRYWTAAERAAGRTLDGGVFVDKLPLNITELALVNAVFPDARVIVALRDPRDVCLSCFMQDFRLNRVMVHFVSLERTVAFYAEVMAWWLELRDVITLPVLEVRYEDTVADLRSQTRRLLDFLGVPWDDRVLDFHESARARLISTPSYAAVTERVHTRAVGRWRHHVAAFASLQGQLAPFVEAFGYETA